MDYNLICEMQITYISPVNDDGCFRLFLTFIVSYMFFFLVWSGRVGHKVLCK